ncbi:MAG: DUF3786 domain-containing protein [Deltaproteobacteria bacterium]|nr:DUF3786 domain-containing protein [Deltaproteobacteria bacterium]
MFRSNGQTNYDVVYESLRNRLSRVDREHAVQSLGANRHRDGLSVKLLGRTCLVTRDEIQAADGKPLAITSRLCLAYYLLHAGRGNLEQTWVAYRDFKDGAFFHTAYAQLVENEIAGTFAGRLPRLRETVDRIGGEVLPTDSGGDLCAKFLMLPRIPLSVVFYDADDDFPASARVLYDASATRFLDMECLAVLGLILKDELCDTHF